MNLITVNDRLSAHCRITAPAVIYGMHSRNVLRYLCQTSTGAHTCTKHIHVHTPIHAHGHTHVRTYIRMCACMRARACVCVLGVLVCVCVCARVCARARGRACVCVCLGSACAYVGTYTLIHLIRFCSGYYIHHRKNALRKIPRMSSWRNQRPEKPLA